LFTYSGRYFSVFNPLLRYVYVWDTATTEGLDPDFVLSELGITTDDRMKIHLDLKPLECKEEEDDDNDDDGIPDLLDDDDDDDGIPDDQDERPRDHDNDGKDDDDDDDDDNDGKKDNKDKHKRNKGRR